VNAPSGFLLVDKEAGPTSRQVTETVSRLLQPEPPRRRRGQPRFRVGHAGTLDPLATGLLIVLAGAATRLQPFLQGLDKRYAATIRLGTATDSHDREGAVTARAPVAATPDDLAAALASLTGTYPQLPPLLSAIKRGGRSLHELVRAGQVVAAPASRPVRIDRLTVTARRWGETPRTGEEGHLASDGLVYEIGLDVVCGSGTYIRALARDLGTALATCAHLHALRRLEVGPFAVAEAVTLAALAAAPELAALVRPLADALPHVPAFTLDEDRAAHLRRGGQPEPDWVPLPVPALCRFLDPAGHLAAVARRDPDGGRPVLAAVFPLGAAASPEDEPCG